MKYIVQLILFSSILISCGETITENKDHFDEKERYIGQMKDGKKHGYGKIIYEDGTPKVIGVFRNDSLSAMAEYHDKKGNYYLGDWKNNQWNGVGIARWADGKYAGDSCVAGFKNSVLHGFGHYFNHNGEIYIGFYENGQQNGIGSHNYTTGERKGDYYVGEIKNGMMHGAGYYYNAEEDIAAYLYYENGEIIRIDSTLKQYVDSLENELKRYDNGLYEISIVIKDEFKELKKNIDEYFAKNPSQ